jgi:hypothetical protein
MFIGRNDTASLELRQPRGLFPRQLNQNSDWCGISLQLALNANVVAIVKLQ